MQVLHQAEENALAVRAQGGDREAFADLVRRYQARVFAFLLRLLGSRADAQELAQESFLRAFRALPAWQPQAPFRAWLFQIAHNAACDHLRRCGALHFVALEADDEAPALAVADPAPTPEQRLHDRQRLALLERALERLPFEQREILLLREIEELSYADIGVTLGLAEGTVKSRLARARLAVLDHFRRLAGEGA